MRRDGSGETDHIEKGGVGSVKFNTMYKIVH